MLRYFCLLCLLFAIKSILCYDYISDHNFKPRYGRRMNKNRGTHHKIEGVGGKHYAHKSKQGYVMEDKEPVAQIDVASFIQKPDDYAGDNSFLYGAEPKRSDTSIDSYTDYGTTSEDNKDDVVKRSNKRPYYLYPGADKPSDLGPNPFPSKGTINSRHLNLDSLSLHGLNNGKIARNLEGKPTVSNYDRAFYDADNNIVHNPEKKCAIKEMMKLPFFFHNKNETGTKIKKPKKRKLFCFDCAKKKHKEEKSKDLAMDSHDVKEANKKETLGKIPKAPVTNTKEDVDLKPNTMKREKRAEYMGERERQLKELEEIQRKVDNVEILPVYGREQSN